MERTYEAVQEKLAPEMQNIRSVGDVIKTGADLWEDEQYLTYAPTGEQYTFEEMNRYANLLGNSLLQVGVEPGDRVGMYLTNCPEYVATYFGCSKAGAIATAISWEYRKRELLHAITEAEISTIVTEGTDEMVDILLSVDLEDSPLEQLLVFNEDRLDDLRSIDSIDVYHIEKVFSEVDETDPGIDVGNDSPVCIVFTSGTTGLPKATLLTNNSVLLGAKSFLGAPFADDDVHYNPYPLFHSNNQCYSLLGTAIYGSEYILDDTLSISNFWDPITNYDVTSFNIIGGVPKMLDSTYSDEEIPENSLQLAIGPISANLWDHFEDKFDIAVIQIYAQTEYLTLLMNHPDLEQVRVGAIGKPMFPDLGHEAWLEDSDGNSVEPGEKGEMVRKGPGTMTEYWNQPEKTAETLRDEVIYSGDICRMDEDEYYYYVDRKKFMVRRSGENISAQEVENVIEELAEVSAAAIIPVPDDFRGEEVKALVKPNEGSLSEEDIVVQVAQSLATHKVPRFVEFVEEFPLTPSERIQRVKLADEEKERSDHGWDRDENFSDWEENA